VFLASRTSISARVYRPWTDKKCKITRLYRVLDGWTDKTHWCAPLSSIVLLTKEDHFVVPLCRPPSSFVARLSPPWLRASVVKNPLPPGRLSSAVPASPWPLYLRGEKNRTSVCILSYPWLRIRFENVTPVTALLRLVLRLEPSKSPGFAELVTAVTAVTP